MLNLRSANMETIHIVILIIVAVILLGVATWLFIHVLRHVSLKRQIKEINLVFEKKHSIFWGSDQTYRRRLEAIKNANLLYASVYQNVNKTYQDIRDGSDSRAEHAVNDLKHLAASRRYKELREKLPEAKGLVNAFCEEVDAFDASLVDIFKPEEDTRSKILAIKTRCRNLKQDYNAKANDLIIVAESFEKVFKRLDDYLDETDNFVDSAHYDEANDLLDAKITPIIEQCAKILCDLPQICVEVTNILPDRLALLRDRYGEMVNRKYPVEHILKEDTMLEMQKEISVLTEAVKALKLAGVQEAIDGILSAIDGYLKGFSEESAAHDSFVNDKESIYEQETTVQKDYIALCHRLPEIKAAFLFDSEDNQRELAIQTLVNRAGAAKRTLDMYLNGGIKQPYSVLLEKLTALHERTDEAHKAIEDFFAYLERMSVDFAKASSAVKEYFTQVRNAERTIRDFDLPSVSARFNPSFEAVYALIDDLYRDILEKPADLKKIRANAASLTESGQRLIMETDAIAVELKRAEKAIVNANRFRENPAVDNALHQAEDFFRQGDFRHAFELAESVAKGADESVDSL